MNIARKLPRVVAQKIVHFYFRIKYQILTSEFGDIEKFERERTPTKLFLNDFFHGNCWGKHFLFVFSQKRLGL